jgi:hypothetical protein
MDSGATTVARMAGVVLVLVLVLLVLLALALALLRASLAAITIITLFAENAQMTTAEQTDSRSGTVVVAVRSALRTYLAHRSDL